MSQIWCIGCQTESSEGILDWEQIKSSNLPSSLNINGHTVKDNELIAEEINKYLFFNKIKETITPTDKPPDDYIEPLYLNF